MNPYKVLGISEAATADTIKQAYLQLARQHHPDRGGDAAKFKEAQQAYDLLTNPRPNESPRPTHSPHINPADFANIFTHKGHPFGDIFSQFTQQRSPPTTNHINDSDIQFNLKVNLEQIKRGATTSIRYIRNKICSNCNGQGGQQKTHCQDCRGAGVRTIRHSPTTIEQTPCPSCNGKGVLWQHPCQFCNTNGYIQHNEEIKVKIGEDK